MVARPMSACARYRRARIVRAMTRRTSTLSLLVPAAVVFALVGCGSGGPSSTATAAGSGGYGQSSTSTPSTPAPTSVANAGELVKLTASPSGQLRFTSSHASVPRPGPVTLILRNPASTGMEHGIGIQGPGIHRDGPIVGPGGTSKLTVTLRKGTFTYYCPVPGHRQAGMTGKLTVG